MIFELILTREQDFADARLVQPATEGEAALPTINQADAHRREALYRDTE